MFSMFTEINVYCTAYCITHLLYYFLGSSTSVYYLIGPEKCSISRTRFGLVARAMATVCDFAFCFGTTVELANLKLHHFNAALYIHVIIIYYQTSLMFLFTAFSFSDYDNADGTLVSEQYSRFRLDSPSSWSNCVYLATDHMWSDDSCTSTNARSAIYEYPPLPNGETMGEIFCS